MKNKFLMFMVVLMVLGYTFLCYAQPRPARTPKVEVERGPQQEAGIEVSDDPVIREFSVNPASVLQGGQVTFSWKVEPSPGGSPITGIRITVGAIELHRSTSAIGEQRVNLPPSLEPRPACQFVLTATNSAGRYKQRTLNLEILADTPVIREFSVEPNVVMAGGEFRLIWRVEPTPGGSRVARVMLGPDSVPSSGERTIKIDRNASDERRQYTLTAINERGQSVSQNRIVEIKSLDSIKRSITFQLTMEPAEIYEDTTGNFTIIIRNESNAIIEGTRIVLIAKRDESGSGPIIGALYNQTIRPGINEFRISGKISERTDVTKPRFLGISIYFGEREHIHAAHAMDVRTITIESYSLSRGGGYRIFY